MVNEQMLKEHIVNLCPNFSFHRKIAGLGTHFCRSYGISSNDLEILIIFR